MKPRVPLEERLPRFSLHRRVAVLVLFLSTIVVGAVAARSIPIELFPNGFTSPFLRVFVPWRDAPPKEVHEKLALPLEEELATVKGIASVRSYSLQGRASVHLEFKHGTDMDVAYREVRDRIERARRSFPEDADQVYVFKEDTSGIPVQVYGVAIDPTRQDAYDLIQRAIVRPLQRIEGVANVTTDGLEEKEILIELDRERTSAAGLNIYQLAQSLSSDNFTLASGNVRDGSRKLLLRSIAEYRSVDELQSRLVAPNIRLRDIATIRYEEAEKVYRVRANSKPAFALVVFKVGDANTREVARTVQAEFERIKADPRLADFEMIEIFDQGKAIDESLSTVLSNGLQGGMLAAAVLFFFLRRVRLMLVVALAIPLSLVIALITMFFAGETLNLLSLLGLMICVGLLVDNSVVVAENINRLYREGLSRWDATIGGTSEIALAITMSTLTTVVVFLPVSLVDGPIRFFLLRMAIPICVSLLASLAVALVFVPLCVYLSLSKPPEERPDQGVIGRFHARTIALVRAAYEFTLGRLGAAYDRLLARFLTRRFDLVLLAVGVFLFTVAGPPKEALEFVNQQEGEQSAIRIYADMPPSYSMVETEEWFREAERIIESRKDEWGLGGWFVVHRRAAGRVEAFLDTPRKVDLTAKEITAQIKQALPARPGIELYSDEESETGEKGPAVFVATLVGEDADELARVADDVRDVLETMPGVIGAKRSQDDASNEIGLVVDRDRAQQLGANPQAIAGVVAYALRGASLPKYSEGGREIPVRVRFEERDRENLDQLGAFLVPVGSGSFLPISALTSRTTLDSPVMIVRTNKQIARTITLDIEKEGAERTRQRLRAMLASIDLPEGIRFGEDEQSRRDEDDLAGLRFALFLSIAFIYLLMAFLFESFVLPLSILFTIPLAWIGVAWTHLALGMDVDFLGAIGVILLVGVVVNNGIVLIDYVNRLRQEGHSRADAIRLATQRRFRPIMMTAITTIGGMVPLALSGATSIGLSYTSFALTLIGGMTTATLLTLLVVPILYSLFDDTRELVGGSLVRVFKRPRPAEAHHEAGA